MATTTPPHNSLPQSEAIELAYTLAAAAAEHVGVRALAIKGLVASAHHLRADRTPADIDILIDPAGFEAVRAQLEAWGWFVRIEDALDTIWQQHSATYIHQQWPCDIDAHHRFPGLLAEPQQAFDALWERREPLPIAGRRIPVTDWASSVAIMAAHSARSSPGIPRHATELRALADLSSSWDEGKRAGLADLAVATGCVQSLEAVWTRFGVALDPAAEEVRPDDLSEWRTQQSGRLPGVRMWLRYVVADGPRHSLSRLRVALWPPEDHIRRTRQVPEGRLGLFRARATRLVAMIGKAPGQLLAIVRGGDNVTQSVVEVGPVERRPHRRRSELHSGQR